jgi:hypothetical protein
MLTARLRHQRSSVDAQQASSTILTVANHHLDIVRRLASQRTDKRHFVTWKWRLAIDLKYAEARCPLIAGRVRGRDAGRGK